MERRGLAPPVRIERRRSDFQTSFPLEQLAVELRDGSELKLAFKRVDWADLAPSAQLAKPRFLHDPRREPAVYEQLLDPAGLGPRFFGSLLEPASDRHWLFVEWVAGRELYQVGEVELWAAAASWLGRMHLRFQGEAGEEAALLDHDASFYRRWMERACGFARETGQPAGRARALAWLAARHEAVVEALLGLPRTIVHGEFYASNVLVEGEAAKPRVTAVDWEQAATGPGVSDLAALVSGGWEERERARIVAAYAGTGAAVRQLDFARLQLAIQWLGWAPPAWEPPVGQRQDWLGEAVTLAEGLGL